MRTAIAFSAILLGSLGCNRLLGIQDLGGGDDSMPGDACAGACQCAVDTDCADPHAVCDVTNSCTCAAGYTDGDTGCTWTGVIADPELRAPPNTAWQTTAGATIAPDAMTDAMSDGGEATFSGSACDVMLSQSVVMPRASRAQPLVARYSVRSTMPGGHENGALSYRVGAHWVDPTNMAGPGGSWQMVRRCLDADAYAPETTRGPGATVAVGLTMFGREGTCGEITTQILDYFDVVPANDGECPPLAVIVNGDAEGAGGWTFSANATYGATSGFAAGIGDEGTRGVDMHWGTECGYPTATLTASLPAAATALAFSRSLPPGHSITIGSVDKLSLVGGGPAQLCLPAAQRGRIDALLFAPASNSGTTDCTAMVGYDAYVDDVALVDDPACAGDPDIADPGFESQSSVVAGVGNLGGGRVAITRADGAAATGAGALAFTVPQATDGAAWSLRIVVPDVVRPALQFSYRATTATAGRFVIPGGGAVADGAWHTATACLTVRVGRLQSFAFGFTPGGTGATPDDLGFLDDLSIVSSDACM